MTAATIDHHVTTPARRGRLVRPATGATATCAALAIAASGCFFTSPINSAPQASIEKQSDGPHHRGEAITFSAAGSTDPDRDPLTVSWFAFACGRGDTGCDDAPFETRTPDSTDQPFTLEVPVRRFGVDALTEKIEVRAEVRDKIGATQTGTLSVDIANLAPTASLQVVGYRVPGTSNHPVGTTARILATGDDGDDGGELSYQWELSQKPGGATADLAALTETSRELAADLEGGWEVTVTVSDGQDTATDRRSLFFTRDRPPCIELEEPQAVGAGRYIVDAVGSPRRFGVAVVEDDLDFWPEREDPFGVAGTVAFRWFVATPDRPGELVPIPGHVLSDYAVDPALYSPGDTLTLRVEIEDRVDRAIACNPAEPTCAIEGGGCLQRVTWEMEIR